jgi:uncharacterized protein (DUF1810 family)
MDLERFVTAQDGVYERALAEIRNGVKSSHWMWFIFPQLRGLGFSERAHFYGLADADEATAYLAHPLLGPRLHQCCAAMRDHDDIGADFVLGAVDARKWRSTLTLFAALPGADPLFAELLALFYNSQPDDRTQALLGLR